MRRKDTDITENTAFEPEGNPTPEEGTRARRRDTDLSEQSVSRRQFKKAQKREAKRQKEDQSTADRAPWDEQPGAGVAAENIPVTSNGDGQTSSSAASQQDQQPEQTKKKASDTLASVLSGNILSKKEVTRAYPYMIFVACLMFLYIANIFRTQYIFREHAALTEQVKELRSKSMTIASDKMKATRQSNIMLELERRGIPLRESLTPNKVIPKDKPRHGQEENDR